MDTPENLIDLECPNCNFEISQEITTVINMGDQALEDLLNGYLNRVVCNQCATDFFYETPIIFKDEQNGYFIYFMPAPEGLPWTVAENNMQSVIEKAFEDMHGEEPELRLTLSKQAFIEKIAIHLNELDDKIVEYFKFQIFNTEASINPTSHELLYDFSSSNDEFIEFTVFDKKEKRPVSNNRAPMTIYNQFQELFNSDNPPVQLEQLFRGYYVHTDVLFNPTGA